MTVYFSAVEVLCEFCDKLFMLSGFRDLPSILPLNQELSFAFQLPNNITELPHLPLFDAFQSKGISQF